MQLIKEENVYRGILAVPITTAADNKFYNLQQTTISSFAAFSKITNKEYYCMRIVCQQTILMKYHTLFYSLFRKDVTKFVVCCSRDWCFKG